MKPASILFVLHAHLPFVREPGVPDFLEERWLFEAISECYLPLIDVLERMQKRSSKSAIVLSVSPTVVAMLSDELLRQRFEAWLIRLREFYPSLEKHFRHQPESRAVRTHRERHERILKMWAELDGDVLGAFRKFADTGVLELWTTAATHAFLPGFAGVPQLVHAQIRIAFESHRRAFGREPSGFWLPECAFDPALLNDLAELRELPVVVEGRAMLLAEPRPPEGIFRPARLSNGMIALGRDSELCAHIWSREAGYPGDVSYREFHHDLGWNSPLELIGPLLPSGVIRAPTGIKLKRITNLEPKHVYDADVAELRAREHATDYFFRVRDRVESLKRAGVEAPVVTLAFDAELFGHWWHEGPVFLDAFLRSIEASSSLRVCSSGDALFASRSGPLLSLPPTTWGKNENASTWLSTATSDEHAAVVSLARQLVEQGPSMPRRLFAQALRELCLAAASDWPFLIANASNEGFARSRLQLHTSALKALLRPLNGRISKIDTSELDVCEMRDNLFAFLSEGSLAREFFS